MIERHYLHKPRRKTFFFKLNMLNIHITLFCCDCMPSACRCRNSKNLKLCPLIQKHAVVLWVARCAHHNHASTHLTPRGLIIWVITDQKHHITWPTESLDSLQPSQRDQYYVVGFPWCGNTAFFFCQNTTLDGKHVASTISDLQSTEIGGKKSHSDSQLCFPL